MLSSFSPIWDWHGDLGVGVGGGGEGEQEISWGSQSKIVSRAENKNNTIGAPRLGEKQTNT